VRLRRRNFHARVRVVNGTLLLNLGLVCFECTAPEAIRLALDLADGVEQLQRGGESS
jgi:hypothetical protein